MTDDDLLGRALRNLMGHERRRHEQHRELAEERAVAGAAFDIQADVGLGREPREPDGFDVDRDTGDQVRDR